MRRSISESKHSKYLQNVKFKAEQLPDEDKTVLLEELNQLDNTYRTFYELLQKARNMVQDYESQQAELTKQIKRCRANSKYK